MLKEPPTQSHTELGGRKVRTPALPFKYNQIAAHVQSFLCGLESRVSDEQVYRLRECYSYRETPRINYNEYAPAFTLSYFLENYWKAASVFEAQHPVFTRASHTVMDIGCGSGATSLGYLTSLDNAVPVGAIWSVCLQLVDHSKEQLLFARQLIEAVRDDFNRLNITIEDICADFNRHDIGDEAVNCLLFGYVLNENPTTLCKFVKKAFAASKGGGQIYIIERRDDAVWDKLREGMGKIGVPYTCDVTGVSTRYIEKNRSRRLASKEQLRVRYMLVDVPHNKKYVETLCLYFKAWETQDESFLSKVFTEEAEYHEKPFQCPLKGLPEIRRYWREKVGRQKNINTKVLRTAYTRAEVFVEWGADFLLDGRKVEVKGAMVWSMEEDTGLVYMLREYFRTHKTLTS